MRFLKSKKKSWKNRKIVRRFAFFPTELSGNGYVILWEWYYAIKTYSPVFRIRFAGEGEGQHYWKTRRRQQSIFGFRKFLKKYGYFINRIKIQKEKQKSLETFKKLLGDKWDKRHHIAKTTLT